MEELDDGLLIYTNNANLVADSFLIDDLWEFSTERIGGNSNLGGGNISNSHSESSLTTILDSARSSYISQPNSDILPFSTLGDGEMELEWLSTFEEWSNAENCGESQKKQTNYESKSTVSDTKSWPSLSLTMVIPCRARSKRTRLQVNPPKSRLSNITQETSSIVTHISQVQSVEDEEEEEYEEKLKKVKRKGVKGRERSINGNSGQPRRCTHCQTQKTPQWRQGPLGPKSLCNACGVRFKTGRLYPEYRPAKSPSFVGFLHSNSHKKVLEMRTLCTGRGNDNGIGRDALPASISCEPSFV